MGHCRYRVVGRRAVRQWDSKAARQWEHCGNEVVGSRILRQWGGETEGNGVMRGSGLVRLRI